jgi:hypothetical protein
MQGGLRHAAHGPVTNESPMYLPAKNTLSFSLLVLALFTSVGCAKVAVTRTSDGYAARATDCPVAWEHGSYAQVASQYEWLGEVTLRNERGVVLTESDRDLLQAQACQIGGDTLVRTTPAKQTGTGVAAFSEQRFGVLRRRQAPESSGSAGEPAPELPRRAVGGGETIAGSSRRPVEGVR